MLYFIVLTLLFIECACLFVCVLDFEKIRLAHRTLAELLLRTQTLTPGHMLKCVGLGYVRNAPFGRCWYSSGSLKQSFDLDLFLNQPF